MEFLSGPMGDWKNMSTAHYFTMLILGYDFAGARQLASREVNVFVGSELVIDHKVGIQ